jgi:large subunit ribosomal protein L15
MQIHEIKRVHAQRKKKLVARGGKRGKTSGRGGKGQTARAGHSVRPAMRDIIKKLPKLRGHGKNRSKSTFYRGPEAVVNVSSLNIYKAGDLVTPVSLLAEGLIPEVVGSLPKVKILGTGELTVKINVEGCTVSVSAKTKIEKLGGTIKDIPMLPVTVLALEKKAAKDSKKAAKKSAKASAGKKSAPKKK